jgi:hypothetical protein
VHGQLDARALDEFDEHRNDDLQLVQGALGKRLGRFAPAGGDFVARLEQRERVTIGVEFLMVESRAGSSGAFRSACVPASTRHARSRARRPCP